MKKTLLQWLQIVGGLIVYAMGVHLTIRAAIGVSPWDAYGLGLESKLNIPYGIIMTVTAVVILAIDLLLKEKIGFGTVIDALLTANMVDLFNRIDPFPKTEGIILGIVILISGLVLMAFGQFIYMKAGQCCGPKDSLLVALGKRLPKVPIGFVQIAIWLFALAIGWLTGGPIGIGTVLSTVCNGLVMQLVFHIVRFEPRKVEHKSIIETVKIMQNR